MSDSQLWEYFYNIKVLEAETADQIEEAALFANRMFKIIRGY